MKFTTLTIGYKNQNVPEQKSNLSGQDENDLCVSNPMHGIINMKRMIMKDMGSGLRLGKREEDVPMPQWRLMEWARQLHDLERYLAFCNRRNNVSKIRLL